jgi:hypothetical protein
VGAAGEEEEEGEGAGEGEGVARGQNGQSVWLILISLSRVLNK